MDHRIFRLLTTAFILLMPSLASAQYENITIFKSKVNNTGPCAPVLFINPKNPGRMAMSMVHDKTMQTTGTKTGHSKVFFSKDYGRTWSVRNAKSKFGDFGDPCMLADNEGYFYYFHVSDPEKMGWDSKMVMDRIICQRSSKGTSWTRGASIGHSQTRKNEKPWAAFDETSGRVLVTWTQYDRFPSSNPTDSAHIMFSYSNDRGFNWTPAVRINQTGGDCSGGISSTVGPRISSGPQNDVYVTWANNEKIYFDRSSDGGISWLRKDIVIADQPGGWQMHIPGFGKASGTPANGCDLSYGPFHGNIYVSWADQRNGEENTDIWISKSTDKGNTWSEPKRVNDDESTMMGTHQCFNAMSVDPITGYIYIIFYDRRNHDDLKTDVYMATSTDGGETFKNELISAVPFEPNPDVYMGDYIHIASYGGFVRPVWTHFADGELSIVTAIINQR